MIFNKERILVVAAHPDDETIGMGGTILKAGSLGSQIRVVFLSDGIKSRIHIRESLVARRNSALRALRILNCLDVHFNDFPDNSMDTVPLIDIVKVVEWHIKDFNPSIVFTHFPQDLNVDHQISGQAALVATRPKKMSPIRSLLFFEVQSSTEWNFGSQQFSPNYFVDITQHVSLKLDALKEYDVEMQDFPEARSIRGIESRNIVRGVTIGTESAEAFQIAFFRA